MNPLRILIVTDHYPPFIGGAHRQSFVLSQKLCELGYTVSVATVWHGGLPEYQNDNGVEVHRLKQIATWGRRITDKRQRHHPPFADPFTTVGLRRLIDKFQPDVVHSHGWITYSCALALTGKNIPLLISARDYGYTCPTRTLLYHDKACSGPALAKCLECSTQFYGKPKGSMAVLGVFTGRRLLLHKMSGLHNISTYVQSVMDKTLLTGRFSRNQDCGDKAPLNVIIPSFLVDADDKVGVSAASIDSLPKEPFILFVGALQKRKGIEQLLAAYEKLVNPPPLVLVGTVERDTPRTLPKGVVLLQNFSHGSVMVAWERCMFGVVPSLWPEPLGAVVFEAMSRGRAVIGTTPGGHTDMIIDGETGYLVSPGNVAQLTDAMRRLIDNPDMRERFGQAGHERIKLFTADVAIPRFEAVYRQLVKRRYGTGTLRPANTQPRA